MGESDVQYRYTVCESVRGNLDKPQKRMTPYTARFTVAKTAFGPNGFLASDDARSTPVVRG